MPVGKKSGKNGVKSGVKIGKSEWKILEQMYYKPSISIPQIAENIGLGTTAVENNIKKLKGKKLLKRIGSAKGGYWKIKEVD